MLYICTPVVVSYTGFNNLTADELTFIFYEFQDNAKYQIIRHYLTVHNTKSKANTIETKIQHVLFKKNITLETKVTNIN